MRNTKEGEALLEHAKVRLNKQFFQSKAQQKKMENRRMLQSLRGENDLEAEEVSDAEVEVQPLDSGARKDLTSLFPEIKPLSECDV